MADRSGEDWTDQEIDHALGTYFEMLLLELEHKSFVKADFRRQLAPKLDGRSKRSIEFKFLNVSAVLDDLGLPHIEGYKPATHYQRKLLDRTELYLEAHPDILNRIDGIQDGEAAHDVQEPLPTMELLRGDPPRVGKRSTKRRVASTAARLGRHGTARDAANKKLGDAGEAFVFDLEKRELIAVGRPDLAERVEWVANTQGDGLGYDVMSFAADGSELHIEVKTTNLSRTTPFFVTANEVAVSEEKSDTYRLYRLFAFSTSPRLYVLEGSLRDTLDLEPIQYRAVPRGQ